MNEINYRRASLLIAIVAVLVALVSWLFPLAPKTGPIVTQAVAPWEGTWTHTSMGPSGEESAGIMHLDYQGEHAVVGSFESEIPSSGTLEGHLSDNGKRLEGVWRNNRGQRGQFVFVLGADNRFFKGYYSMGDERPGANTSNFWNGNRRP